MVYVDLLMAECHLALSLSIPIPIATPTPIVLRPPRDSAVQVIGERFVSLGCGRQLAAGIRKP